MAWAFGCVVVVVVGYGVGTVFQAIGAARADRAGYLDVGLLLRLARQGPYVLGLAFDAVAFVAAVVALQHLPLFVVQAAVAASVGVTAVVASAVLDVRLSAAEHRALFALVGGLALLAVAARPEPGAHLDTVSQWLVLAGVPVVIVVGVISARRPGSAAALGLAVAAGAGFASTAIAARATHVPTPAWHLAFEPLTIALVAYGACGMLMFASALQRGSVTSVSAVMFAVETLIPTVVGVAVLGDRTRPYLEPVAALGFVTAIGASLLLARHATPAVDAEATPTST